jgi:hypothetical protein
MDDRFARMRDQLRKAILEREGTLDRETRRKAYEGHGKEGPIATYVATVYERAYDVDDRMFDELRKEGLDDDAIFELTVATAVGKANQQFDAAMAALASATEE